MQMTAKAWLEYISGMSAIDQKAVNLMQRWIDKHGTDDRASLIAYADALIQRYGQASGALACEMYEATAAAQGVAVPAAEMAELPSYAEVGKAINGTLKVNQKVPNTVGRLVKQVGADTTLKNAKRDGAQFAWIPHGDTCAFCIALASRGWQYMSKNALRNGHAEHIHVNCDCQYAIRFDGKSTVEGYDLEKYRDMYYGADGTTSQEKINSMRRAQREENKDQVNARKRELYNSTDNQLLRLAKQGNTFLVKTDDFYEYSRKIKPIEGYEDIVAHGDMYSLVFKDADGNESNVSAAEFCDLIEKGGTYQGGRMRLIACQTGAGDGIVPTYIAKHFNTEVLAPTEIVNVGFEGNMCLADSDYNAKMGIETGEWVLFNGEGRVE